MRAIRLVFASAVLACLGCISQAQTAKVSNSAMLDCSGLPCVDMTVSGKHVKMLVDTGNANSLLDASLAKDLGLDLKPVNGPDGKPYPGYSAATAANVMLGETALGDMKFLVVDLQPSIQKGELPKADGTLAYTALKGRILRMDYKQQQVGISDVLKSDEPCPKFCGTISHPTFGKQGPPIVVTTGFEVNGNPITVQVDTLYTGSMLIYPTSVDKLGLTEQQKSTQTRMFPYTDGGVEMIEGKAKTEAFDTGVLQKDGTLYFATPKVHAPDGMFDGTVGQELFQGHVVTMDFHSHHFWMS